jgi:hypothetical protein
LGDYLVGCTPETVYLKISTKNAAGKVVWAHVAPSLWNDTVSEGAELRILAMKNVDVHYRLKESHGKQFDQS